MERHDKDNLDLGAPRDSSMRYHFGLDEVKERFWSIWPSNQLKGDLKSPILCLYGPPGVGKTSLGKSWRRWATNSAHFAGRPATSPRFADTAAPTSAPWADHQTIKRCGSSNP